ncbi:diacylglycerol kinase family lipid kinase [Bacillus carboniphilus]|uniref:Diacylglycerol kinase family lipid kinase n=1 Tax=Bacillus carboniphilus TaxID=86663 RepID=A0ABP3G2H8_9BACI
MTMNNSFVFIVNPNARNGKSQKLWRKIEKELIEKEIPYEVFKTEAPLHATQLTKEILARPNFNGKIIAVGGDGTINEVANDLGKSKVTVTCLPAGSGCDFARGYGIPLRGDKSFLWLLNQKYSIEDVDFGSYEIEGTEGFFVNNLGCGFDAVVAKSANGSKLKKWFNNLGVGKLVYVYFLLKHTFSFQTTDVEIKVDQRTYSFKNMWFLTFNNHPFFGGGMKLSPVSHPSDGELELTVVHNLSRIKLLSLFITVFWGGHTKLKEVTSLKGKNFYVQTKSPQVIHADGEIIGQGNLQVQIESDGLTIMKPSERLDLKMETDIKSKRLPL